MTNMRYTLFFLFVFFTSVNNKEQNCEIECTAILDDGMLTTAGTGKNEQQYVKFVFLL